MNPISWKKEFVKRGTPFLKKFAGKVKRKLKPDLDDIHDTADVHKYTEAPGLLEKGLMFGVDMGMAPFDPMGAGLSLAQQGNEGEFIHDVSTNLPELPTVGGFRVGHDPTGETDIGKQAGQFLRDKVQALGTGIAEAYNDNAFGPVTWHI